MEVNFHKLNGQYECDRRRFFATNVKSENTVITKQAGAQRDVLTEVLRGTLEIDDIGDSLHERMEDIPYKSIEGKRRLLADMTKRLKRAAKSFETRKNQPVNPWTIMVDLPKKDIVIPTDSDDIIVNDVSPDIIVLNGDWINVYKVRTGAAKNKDGTAYTDIDASKDKQVYVLLKYGQQFAEDMGITTKKMINAGFIFLRKRTDRNKTAKSSEHFDTDLFLTDDLKYSDNIVTISEVYNPFSTEKSGQDKAMEPFFKKYTDGYSAEECTQEQCENCDLADICNFKHAPIRVDEKKRGTQVSAINLSTTQEDIELFKSGYALVNAVPGAGKTLVLVLRIVELLNDGVLPSEIAIITFTNSGAEVFKERIAKYNEEIGTGEDVSDMVATTFNGLGQMILEKEYKNLGFTAPPKVIDPIERSGIIAELLNQYNVPDLDYRNFTTDMKSCKGPLAVASKVFEIMKSKGLTAFDANEIAAEVGYTFCSVDAAKKLAEIYDVYNDYLKSKNLVEYADQEVILLDLLQKNPYYFDQFGWKHILVDECQDTSENQFRLLRYMTKTAAFESLMVVGDDSQSIYGFRDTSPKFFINFESTMELPEGAVHTYYMTDNFRSTPEIIDFANRLIDKNTEKVVKEIFAKNHKGDAVTAKGFIDQKDEYDWIVKEIAREIESGTKHEDIAFIASNRTELMKMAGLLTENEIPSVMLNPERYLENSRVRAGISLAKYFQDRTDTKDILIYVNAALGGELLSLTQEQIDAAIKIKQDEANKIYAMSEKNFRQKFFELLEAIDEDDEIYESFIDTLKHHRSMADIFSYCNDFELYGEKAERRRQHSYPGVVLTTAHSSKGMEWPVVFCSVTKFDDQGLHNKKKSDKNLEEKRRLLFVAATRARKKLSITGVYVAFGGVSKPTFNQFLLETFEILGIDFNGAGVTNAMQERAKLRRIEKERDRQRRKDSLLNEINKEVVVKTA